MQEIMNILKSDGFIIGFVIVNFIILIGLIIMIVKISKLNKRYETFIKKIGNGKNIEEDLENYMYKVDRVEKQNAEINEYCKNIDNELQKCIQKVGIVRYNAFKDVGSDLSFALALLDDNNNGIVLNGIYSREMSNIYAKPIKNGQSTYTVSDEENEAIQKAINSNNIKKSN